ncbi:replicative DNA helicase, partial [Patescibacteria group bacterium]|nr:replicative DNA helicase [Patescibacteria group bacterium]
MTDIFKKIPPHNLEAEESLLGSIFIDQESLAKVLDGVKPEDFYKESHKILYEIMLDLFERHEPIDVLTVGN